MSNRSADRIRGNHWHDSMTKKIKVLLVVLLIAAFAGMCYTFHDAAPVEKVISTVQNLGHTQDQQAADPDLTVPHYIIAGDGTYEYKITDMNRALPGDQILEGSNGETEYASFLAALKAIFAQSSAPEAVDDETETGIRESFLKHSLTAVFEYDVPLDEYLAYHGISAKGSLPEDGISRITIFEDGSAALYNRNAGEYYRISPEEEDAKLSGSIRQFIDYILETEESTAEKLQTITSITGVDNSTMIPVNRAITSGPVSFTSEISAADAEDLAVLKNAYFPGGPEFVNQISRYDGSVVLMYGIGKKVLNVTGNGKVIYSEELNTGQYRKTGLFEALNCVSSFLSSRGGTDEQARLELFVKNVTGISKQGRSGYRIDLGVSFHDLEVMYDDDVVMTVEIFGRQVTSCVRNLPDLYEVPVEEPLDAVDGAELIRNNSDAVASVIMELYADDSSINIEKYTSSDSYYAVASSIAEAGIGLVRLDGAQISAAASDEGEDQSEDDGQADEEAAGQQFLPTWHLLVDGVEFWFDAADGRMLTYRKR